MKYYSLFIRNNKELLSRLDDWINIVENNYKVVYTNFYDENTIQFIKQYLSNKVSLKLNYKINNGILYQCAIYYYSNLDIDNNVVLLKTKYNSKYNNITHRDVLGSLLNKGIKRELIGDIVINNNYIYIETTNTNYKYIIDNVTRIKRENILFEVCDEEIDYIQEYESKQVMVSSYRLDSIIASICNVSRSKSIELLDQGCIKIYNINTNDKTLIVEDNSIISIKGYGKYKIEYTNRVSKKHNFVITIYKYV